MTPLARRLVSVFVLALLTLAAVGSYAQQRFLHQAALLRAKDAAIVDVAVARSAAASVNGPLAITRWARERGMVSAPDAPDVIAVAPSPLPPPMRTLVTPSLEVRTVWR
jgi:hypothetical protein